MESYQGGLARDEAAENFQRMSQTIASNIKKISQNVTSMSKMVNQLITPLDSPELRNQLRQIQNYTQKLAKDTSMLLMELMKLPTDQPAHKLTRDRLSDDYMVTLNFFQATQRSAARKTKEDVRKVKAQTVQVGDPFNMGGSSELVDTGETRRQEQMTAQTERDLLELEEREKDVRQLENDITDVNQIFKELGQMIHEQGAAVESIETSVEHAADHVQSATTELRQAASYKNKLRKKKVYIAIILAIIISIILIIVFSR